VGEAGEAAVDGEPDFLEDVVGGRLGGEEFSEVEAERGVEGADEFLEGCGVAGLAAEDEEVFVDSVDFVHRVRPRG
jgi:hypothetical protein